MKINFKQRNNLKITFFLLSYFGIIILCISIFLGIEGIVKFINLLENSSGIKQIGIVGILIFLGIFPILFYRKYLSDESFFEIEGNRIILSIGNKEKVIEIFEIQKFIFNDIENKSLEIFLKNSSEIINISPIDFLDEQIKIISEIIKTLQNKLNFSRTEKHVVRWNQNFLIITYSGK